MNIVSRALSMVGLNRAARNLADALKRRDISADDASRAERHGDVSSTTARAQAFATELDQRTKKIG